MKRKKSLDDVIDREIDQQQTYENQLEDQINVLVKQNQILQTRLQQYLNSEEISQDNDISERDTILSKWRTTTISFILGFIIGNSILAQKILFGKIKVIS